MEKQGPTQAPAGQSVPTGLSTSPRETKATAMLYEANAQASSAVTPMQTKDSASWVEKMKEAVALIISAFFALIEWAIQGVKNLLGW
jgi:hypothetical protein